MAKKPLPLTERSIARDLASSLERSRSTLIPPAFQFLWEKPRFLIAWGGRSSGKSWSIARVLLTLAHEKKLRILCAREIQSSVRESSFRLLADQIRALGLEDFYEVRADSIVGKNGSEFIFEGLRYNISRLRSLEGVDICWVEEAQAVSERSWEDLIPTIRKRGSRFFISFNPLTPEDPVQRRFIGSGRTDIIERKVSWADNQFNGPEIDAERIWMQRTDPDAYRHVWEGFPRENSDALILKGKYTVEEFEVKAAWGGPYHGCDFGFSRDPNAAVCVRIDDTTEPPTAYVSDEHWSLGTEIDALPDALERSIPGISRHQLYCDAARPETVNYLQRHGIPRAVSAEKWNGSVDDGIAYLRSLRIVIHPRCKHTIDEAGSYSFKTDRLTGVALPEPEEKHNHCIDALRYALSPLIRNKPTGGYFSRSALLTKGEALVPPEGPSEQVIDKILITLAQCERPGTGVGVITWGHTWRGNPNLILMDYELVEVAEALTGDFLMALLERAQEHREYWKAVSPSTTMHVEDKGLYDRLEAVLYEEVLPFDVIRAAGGDCLYGLRKAEPYEVLSVDRRELLTLDERAADVRTLINSGKYVKLARSAYTREVTRLSTTTNHLMSQVLAYRPGVKDTAQELVAAMLLGCLLARMPT